MICPAHTRQAIKLTLQTPFRTPNKRHLPPEVCIVQVTKATQRAHVKSGMTPTLESRLSRPTTLEDPPLVIRVIINLTIAPERLQDMTEVLIKTWHILLVIRMRSICIHWTILTWECPGKCSTRLLLRYLVNSNGRDIHEHRGPVNCQGFTSTKTTAAG